MQGFGVVAAYINIVSVYKLHTTESLTHPDGSNTSHQSHPTQMGVMDGNTHTHTTESLTHPDGSNTSHRSHPTQMGVMGGNTHHRVTYHSPNTDGIK